MKGESTKRAGWDPFAFLLKGLIIVYRYSLSYLIGRRCRHLPTCSEYAIEAIDVHGSWRGGWLALSRIVRCRPGGSHGLDPVPDMIEQSYPWWQGWRYGRWSSNEDAGTGNSNGASDNSG